MGEVRPQQSLSMTKPRVPSEPARDQVAAKPADNKIDLGGDVKPDAPRLNIKPIRRDLGGEIYDRSRPDLCSRRLLPHGGHQLS